MLDLLSTLSDRLVCRKGVALSAGAMLLIGAAIGIGRQVLPAAAADGTSAGSAAQSTPMQAGAGPFTPEQKTAIEKIIKDYLMNNPEVMMEVQTALESKMETIQAEKLKTALKDSAKEIYHRPNAPMAGNANGDVTVVEFFDYNCGYCRRAFSDIAKLVDTDPKVRLVFKELPILSKGSEEASKVALAARMQGRYWDIHRALIGMRGEANEQSALKTAEKLGLDMARLKKDMESPEVKAEIDSVRNLAQKMGIQGTPQFLVGDRSIPGAPQNLLEMINGYAADVRKTGCAVC